MLPADKSLRAKLKSVANLTKVTKHERLDNEMPSPIQNRPTGEQTPTPNRTGENSSLLDSGHGHDLPADEGNGNKLRWILAILYFFITVALAGSVTSFAYSHYQVVRLQNDLSQLEHDSRQLKSGLNKYYAFAHNLMGWKTSGNFVYKTFEEPVAYEMAIARCHDIGGRLAAEVLRDPETAKYINHNEYLTPGKVPYTPWIGLGHSSKDGWKWSDNGTTDANTTVWYEDPGETPHGCACIWSFKEGRMLIYDNDCQTPMHYICEVADKMLEY